MKRFALFVALLASLQAGAMTRLPDGSAVLAPEEVANVERNFQEMKQLLEKAG